MKNLKKNNGAISVIVLVTILFFITILTGTYMVNAIIRKSQIKNQLQLKNEYESSLNESYMNSLYDNMVAEYNGI